MIRQQPNDGFVGIAVASRRQIFAANATASAGFTPCFALRNICVIIRSALPALIRISVISASFLTKPLCLLLGSVTGSACQYIPQP